MVQWLLSMQENQVNNSIENSLVFENTFINHIDPRVKIGIFFLYAWTIALSQSFSCIKYGIFLLFLLILVEFKALKGLKILFVANTFLIFIIISMLLTYKEPPFFHIMGLAFSIPALKYGALLLLKSNLILFLTILLIATTSVFSLFHAFHHLKFPNKLVVLAFFTYRYIYTVKEEYSILLKSAKTRGFEIKTSLKTYKTFAYILANLLVKSFKRADKIYKAMLCRGFNGTFPLYVHFKLQKRDFIFAIISIFLYLMLLIF